MEGESGEQVGGELESVTPSPERLVILREEDVGGRERVTTDEERVARGAEQRSGCADKLVEQW